MKGQFSELEKEMERLVKPLMNNRKKIRGENQMKESGNKIYLP